MFRRGIAHFCDTPLPVYSLPIKKNAGRFQWGQFAKKMPEASDNGSQPYSYPLGGCEMAGESGIAHGPCRLGKGHTLLMSPTQGQAILLGGNLIPAISQSPRGQLYGWLPLSNAYGISSFEYKSFGNDIGFDANTHYLT